MDMYMYMYMHMHMHMYTCTTLVHVHVMCTCTCTCTHIWQLCTEVRLCVVAPLCCAGFGRLQLPRAPEVNRHE